MASEPEGSKQQGGWLPNSPISLNAATGWGAAAPSAAANEANAGAERAREHAPQPRYLTTSGLLERPPRLSAPETSELVNEFRTVLLQPQSDRKVQPRKSRKGILALAVAGILAAAIVAAVYLYYPRESAAGLLTAKAWVAKRWTVLRKISSALQSQAAKAKTVASNRPRGLSAYRRGRRSANPGIPVAPMTVWITQSKKNVTPFDLYVTDSHGRRWILTTTGEEFGPVNHLADPAAPKPEASPAAPMGCRSLFYRSACP